MPNNTTAKQELLSITAALSRVISKQTDWNWHTGARPGGGGRTEEEWKGGGWNMPRSAYEKDTTLKMDENIKQMIFHESLCNVFLFRCVERSWMSRSPEWLSREKTKLKSTLVHFSPPTPLPTSFLHLSLQLDWQNKRSLWELRWKGGGGVPSVYGR